MWDTIIRRGYPIVFGLITLFSIIEMCVSAWVAARYNVRRNYPSSATQDRVRFTLFTSIWTVVFSVGYIVLFLFRAENVFVSVASHFGFLFVTWVLWLAAAASMTAALGGSLDCSNETFFLYCGQLNAIEAFAWLIWILITFALIVVLVRGIKSSKNGDGLNSQMVV